jgi:uncharacterized protein with PIN domain
MKFIADVMLGRLARFMRFAGYDVEYDSKATDDFLYHRARYRTLLTRDRELSQRALNRKVYFVQTTGAENQLEEIHKRFPIENASPRCLICNVKISRIAKQKVSHLVPPFVYRSQEQFFHCRRCNRIYWKGTHFDHLARLMKISILNKK